MPIELNDDAVQEQLANTYGNMFKVATSPFSKKQYDELTPLEIKKGFTLGCDPEGFIFNTKTNQAIPASKFIPGTKWAPHKVNKGAVQVDGLAAEFNIDPASTAQEWEDNITTVLGELGKFLPKDHEIRWLASTRFDPEVFDPLPFDQKELGCSPDIDAWTGIVNPPPHLEDPYVRVAGGHVHAGWTKNESLSDPQHILNCQDLIKQMDWFLGGWAATVDADQVRPSLYGKPGACRYKPYGVEYRTLSNFWVENFGLRRAIWNRACSAIDCMAKSFLPDKAASGYQELLKAAILTHNMNNDLMYSYKFPILTINPMSNRWL